MKTKIVIPGLVLLAVILGSLALTALAADSLGSNGQAFGGGMGTGGMARGSSTSNGIGSSNSSSNNLASLVLGEKGLEILGLTAEQKIKIKAIEEEHKAKTGKIMHSFFMALQVLEQAGDTADEAQIRAAGKTAGDALTKEALQRAAVVKKVKAILTDEQTAKLPQLQAGTMEQNQQTAHGKQSFSYSQQQVQK